MRKRETRKVMKAKNIKSQMPTVEVVHGKAVATYNALVSAIENLVSDARTGLKAAMNAIMLQTYWHTGEYIVEYEQNGADRAVYGDGLMRRLARDLTLRLGRGFAHSNLNYMRKFYLMSQKSRRLDFLKKARRLAF